MYKIRTIAVLIALLLWLVTLTGCSFPRYSPGLNLPRNERESGDFSQLSDGTVTYPGAVQGIDVASHQGEIDWQAVRQAGIEFAILQIGYRGYTQGGLNVDERFEENYQGAKEQGIRIGVYFYAQAISREEALQEADFVLRTLDGRELDLPVFYDWEEVAEGRTGGRANASVGEYAGLFCQRVADAGYQAGVYFNQSYGLTIMQLETLTDYVFWLAEYRGWQSFGYEVAFWQYTGQGYVDGIGTNVDRNLMYPAGEEPNETSAP